MDKSNATNNSVLMMLCNLNFPLATRDENFGSVTLAHHKEVLEELVRRDKNRPSAIIWSVANEPASTTSVAENYFK